MAIIRAGIRHDAWWQTMHGAHGRERLLDCSLCTAARSGGRPARGRRRLWPSQQLFQALKILLYPIHHYMCNSKISTLTDSSSYTLQGSCRKNKSKASCGMLWQQQINSWINQQLIEFPIICLNFEVAPVHSTILGNWNSSVMNPWCFLQQQNTNVFPNLPATPMALFTHACSCVRCCQTSRPQRNLYINVVHSQHEVLNHLATMDVKIKR